MQTTLLTLSPRDHGHPLTLTELERADVEPGYRYELIDGRLHVSPQAGMAHNRLVAWLLVRLRVHALHHPGTIGEVVTPGRLVLRGPGGDTAAERDLVAYTPFPRGLSANDLDWEQGEPLLVGEVISPEYADKDLVRNVALYLRFPTIREYWILDPRASADRPTLIAYRRRGSRWTKPIRTAYGATYTTPLLPGLERVMDPFP